MANQIKLGSWEFEKNSLLCLCHSLGFEPCTMETYDDDDDDVDYHNDDNDFDNEDNNNDN